MNGNGNFGDGITTCKTSCCFYIYNCKHNLKNAPGKGTVNEFAAANLLLKVLGKTEDVMTDYFENEKIGRVKTNEQVNKISNTLTFIKKIFLILSYFRITKISGYEKVFFYTFIFALLFLACDTHHETKLPSHLVIINKCCKGLAVCQEEILLNTAEETAVQTQEEDADSVLFFLTIHVTPNC